MNPINIYTRTFDVGLLHEAGADGGMQEMQKSS